ncbi:MAG TPA: GAF domain-containing sensor histidine kinase [Anaerolineae bacterium]|nr:GAF domain-containing sensor histidine kinase [Anaerolineae bacterium]
MSVPGGLIYHLTLVIVLTLLFILARVQRTSDPSQRTKRWYFASAGLLIIRLVLLTTSVLAWQLLLDGERFLPPLDRFASLAGIVLFAWPLLTIKYQRAVDAAVALLLVLALVGMLITASNLMGKDTPYPFNPSLADEAWTLTGLGIAILIIVVLTNLRPHQWDLSLVGFILLTTGYSLHIAFGPREGSLAGFVRWAELMAYPLFSIAGIRALASRPGHEEVEAEILGERIQPGESDPLMILGELSELISAQQISDFASAVVKGVAELTKAELCLLLTPPDLMGKFSVATGYDLIREQLLPGAALDDKSCPVIASALAQHRTLQLPAVSKSPDVQTLQEKLDYKTTGPALLVPLVTKGAVQGGIMLLSPYTHRSWNAEEQHALEQVASHLAQRIIQLNRGALKDKAQVSFDENSYATTLRQFSSLEDRIADLMAQMQSASDMVKLNKTDDPSALLKAYEEALETIHLLEREIKSMKADFNEGANNPSSDDAKRREDKYQMLVRELHEIRARLAAAETRRASIEEGMGEGPDIEAAASLTNQLRQQMSSILEYAELLLGESVGTLGSAQRSFMEHIQDGIKEMDSLLENLLQITTLETGPVPIPDSIDLLQCIEEAVTRASPILREKKIAIRMDFPDDMPSIRGDVGSIVQIVVHLLNNAIGASPEGEEIVVAARLQEAEEADLLLLTFSDAGEGIPAADLGRVFQPVDRADTEPIRGLGESSMGLSIVKALSEAMGGRVWLDSGVGEGSTFTVLMPVAESPKEASDETAAEV